MLVDSAPTMFSDQDTDSLSSIPYDAYRESDKNPDGSLNVLGPMARGIAKMAAEIWRDTPESSPNERLQSMGEFIQANLDIAKRRGYSPEKMQQLQKAILEDLKMRSPDLATKLNEPHTPEVPSEKAHAARILPPLLRALEGYATTAAEVQKNFRNEQEWHDQATGIQTLLQRQIDIYKATAEKAGTDPTETAATISEVLSRLGILHNTAEQNEPSPNAQLDSLTLPFLEKYANQPGITIARDKIKEALAMGKTTYSGGEEKDFHWDLVKGLLYDALTVRGSYHDTVASYGSVKNMINAPETRQKNEEFKQKMQTTYNVLQSTGKYDITTDAWFHVNTRPEAGIRGGNNLKTYTTLDAKQANYIEHFPDLAEKLQQVSLETDDIVKVKTAARYDIFTKINDSIVVHYKKPETQAKVQAVLDAWMAQHGLQAEPRELGRPTHAADTQNDSYSSDLARTVMQEMQAKLLSLPDSQQMDPSLQAQYVDEALNSLLKLGHAA